VPARKGESFALSSDFPPSRRLVRGEGQSYTKYAQSVPLINDLGEGVAIDEAAMRKIDSRDSRAAESFSPNSDRSEMHSIRTRWRSREWRRNCDRNCNSPVVTCVEPRRTVFGKRGGGELPVERGLGWLESYWLCFFLTPSNIKVNIAANNSLSLRSPSRPFPPPRD